MADRHAGWEVVCPDGIVRHYPYHNKDDAEAEARYFTDTKCQRFKKKSPLEKQHPPCPGGEHTVRATVFCCPAGSN